MLAKVARCAVLGLRDTAIKNSDGHYPRGRVVVNLAPANLRKKGPAYDLPIAVGFLVASEQMPPELDRHLNVGSQTSHGR